MLNKELTERENKAWGAGFDYGRYQALEVVKEDLGIELERLQELGYTSEEQSLKRALRIIGYISPGCRDPFPNL